MQDFHWILDSWFFALWISSFKYGLTICYMYLPVCWFSRVVILITWSIVFSSFQRYGGRKWRPVCCLLSSNQRDNWKEEKRPWNWNGLYWGWGVSRSELFQVQLSVHALHRADISHCRQSFPHKMKSEKPAQKFHTDEVSLPSFTISCAMRPIRSIT